MSIITRRQKGSALTYNEMDDNMEYLLRNNTANNIIYDNSVSDLNANNVQSAIDEVATGTPPGAVLYFARQTAPTGWLLANGAAVSRTTYARLFEAVGTLYGTGDGSTTFNLPDLRGEFIRGWDNGRGVDSGRTFGTSQLDAFQGHFHNLKTDNGIQIALDGGGGTGTLNLRADGAPASPLGQAQEVLTNGVDGTPRTAPETRPRNVALLACIKF